MADDARLMDIFMDVQRGLPRQGPGSAAATRDALALCDGLPARPDILDVGCGPGTQTMVLAAATGGRVTAVDIHLEYLSQLTARAATADVAIVAADMAALPFGEASFDLIWSEGAAYIMGVGNAWTAWKPLLRPGGLIAISELVWLRPDPPATVADFFAAEYPAMTDIAANVALLRDRGYQALGHVVLPDAAWWDDYYAPLEAKLPALRAKHAGDGAALAIVETTAAEIDMRRRFADCYGYAFFVGRAQG